MQIEINYGRLVLIDTKGLTFGPEHSLLRGIGSELSVKRTFVGGLSIDAQGDSLTVIEESVGTELRMNGTLSRLTDVRLNGPLTVVDGFVTATRLQASKLSLMSSGAVLRDIRTTGSVELRHDAPEAISAQLDHVRSVSLSVEGAFEVSARDIAIDGDETPVCAICTALCISRNAVVDVTRLDIARAFGGALGAQNAQLDARDVAVREVRDGPCPTIATQAVYAWGLGTPRISLERFHLWAIDNIALNVSERDRMHAINGLVEDAAIGASFSAESGIEKHLLHVRFEDVGVPILRPEHPE